MTGAAPTKETIADWLVDLFNAKGAAAYLGEPVSQAGHMLQSAVQADQFDSPDALVAASLLHDIGHLLHDTDEYHAEHGVDAVHEHVGADFLARFFPPAVTEPVRLHVDAKRWLCFAEPGYFDGLSEASVLSLKLQGGPMTAARAAAFEAGPHFEAAVALRRFDEAAKVAGARTPPVEHYRDLLASLVRA